MIASLTELVAEKGDERVAHRRNTPRPGRMEHARVRERHDGHREGMVGCYQTRVRPSADESLTVS